MKPGDLAPEFALPDQSGARWRLADALCRGPVVLFFYPAALTVGCTRQACHFRDLGSEFRALGAGRAGISADPSVTQAEFARRNSLDFPLLSDDDGAVAELFGARRAFVLRPGKRATFVVGQDRRVAAVVTSELSMSRHADRAIEVLRSLPSPARPVPLSPLSPLVPDSARTRRTRRADGRQREPGDPLAAGSAQDYVAGLCKIQGK